MLQIEVKLSSITCYFSQSSSMFASTFKPMCRKNALARETIAMMTLELRSSKSITMILCDTSKNYFNGHCIVLLSKTGKYQVNADLYFSVTLLSCLNFLRKYQDTQPYLPLKLQYLVCNSFPLISLDYVRLCRVVETKLYSKY